MYFHLDTSAPLALLGGADERTRDDVSGQAVFSGGGEQGQVAGGPPIDADPVTNLLPIHQAQQNGFG